MRVAEVDDDTVIEEVKRTVADMLPEDVDSEESDDVVEGDIVRLELWLELLESLADDETEEKNDAVAVF